MTTLDDKLHQYQQILKKKDELAEATKANNAAKEELEQEICQMMIDEEKPSSIVDGYNFSLKQETMYSKLGEEKLLEKGLDFLEVLREQGLGDIIVERVDPRTLNSTCKTIVEESGELPEELSEVLSVYEKLGLSRRKANTKALDRAKASR
ncbi:MAG: hypothetical protein K5770_00805 [Lachnospiraceae bacterium]|nr:hypothetical protein [Lachnospiraceae bacterium]